MRKFRLSARLDRLLRPTTGASFALLIVSAVLVATRSGGAQAHTTDSASALAAVARFHTALARGDSSAAASLLADSVVVLESGDFESRAEYVRHHLPADIAFARATRSVPRVRRAVVRGDVAWVAATSRTTGRFRGRAVGADGAELVVLERTLMGWRITAVHWSSHAYRR